MNRKVYITFCLLCFCTAISAQTTKTENPNCIELNILIGGNDFKQEPIKVSMDELRNLKVSYEIKNCGTYSIQVDSGSEIVPIDDFSFPYLSFLMFKKDDNVGWSFYTPTKSSYLFVPDYKKTTFLLEPGKKCNCTFPVFKLYRITEPGRYKLKGYLYDRQFNLPGGYLVESSSLEIIVTQ